VADEAIRSSLLAELNSLADAGKTRLAADLLAEKPEKPPQVTLAAPATEELDGPRLYKRLRESTVIVGGRYKCKKCSNWHLNAASGFLISADGVVVTNRHVLASNDLEAMAVMDGAGKVHAVEGLLAQDDVHDVVLLKIEGNGHTPLPLAREEAAPGLDVAVLSHPDGKFWLFTTGVVSRISEWSDSHRKPPVKFPVLCITAPFAPGSSGAPVTDRRGNVLGIAVRITPIMQAKGDDPEHKHEGGEYTAMVIPTVIPIAWVRAALAAPEKPK